jgi:tetratricopeptide (TPR) repeat protein
VQVCLGYELPTSLELAQKSITLNGNSPFGWYAIGLAKLALGHADEAITAIARGFRLNPRDPAGYAYSTSYALAEFVNDDYLEAIAYAEKALALRAWAPALRIKAAAMAKLGMLDDAKLVLQKAQSVDPTGARSLMERMVQLRPIDRTKYIDALASAGLPE